MSKKKTCFFRIIYTLLLIVIVFALFLRVYTKQNEDDNIQPKDKINIYEIEVALSGMVSLAAMTGQVSIIVEGFQPFIDDVGVKRCPAKDAGIQIGDIILELDGFDASVDVPWEVLREGRNMTATIRRGEKTISVALEPIYCQEAGYYRIGINLDREGSFITAQTIMSVTTVSFYDPVSRAFAASGHGIETEPHIDRGFLLGPQYVSGVRNDKLHIISNNYQFLGDVLHNGTHGIYGILCDTYESPFTETFKFARPDEVYDGEAKMLTTINGEIPEFMSVRISGVGLNESGAFTINLSEEYDIGVAQGMSGSVIIQDEKIVGIIARGLAGLQFMVAYPPEHIVFEYLDFLETFPVAFK